MKRDAAVTQGPRLTLTYRPDCVIDVGDTCYPLVNSEVRAMLVVAIDREHHTVEVVPE